MARPRKMRRICCLPEKSLFGPLDMTNPIAEVLMTVEEYEIIRLIDLEGLNQEESSEIMNVARSTIQRLYDDARKKLADVLVNGKQLRIEGGDYEVCEELDKSCLNSGCNRRRHGRHNHI